jgi:hypothetical protein
MDTGISGVDGEGYGMRHFGRDPYGGGYDGGYGGV